MAAQDLSSEGQCVCVCVLRGGFLESFLDDIEQAGKSL